MSELKPCKCGGAAIVRGDHTNVLWVECRACGEGTNPFWTEAEAIAAWNTRTPAPASDDAMEVLEFVCSALFPLGKAIRQAEKHAAAAIIQQALDQREAAGFRRGVEAAPVWLIEMIHNDAPIPRWWNPAPNKGWVWDANDAIRFAREQDARDYLDGQRLKIGGRPTEHKFLALLETQEAG